MARSAGEMFIRLSRDRLDHELALRGLTVRAFAKLARVPEVTMSLARNGRPLRPGTVKRLAAALSKIPVLPGASLILQEPSNGAADVHNVAAHVPETKKTSATPAAGLRGGHGDGSTSTRRRKA